MIVTVKTSSAGVTLINEWLEKNIGKQKSPIILPFDHAMLKRNEWAYLGGSGDRHQYAMHNMMYVKFKLRFG